MDIPVADWVLQTTTTVGTGTITLSLPAPGYTDLQDALKASGDVWYSLLSSTGDRECGIGHFDYDTNTLQRTTIHATLKSGKHSNVSPTPIELKGQSLVSCTFNAESWKQFITDVQVGDVYSLSSTSDPEVTNTGTHSVPVLNFGIPKGDKGDAATIAIAPTVTGNPGTPAGVTNEGDEHNALLKFTIPGSVEVSVGSTTTLDSGSQATVVDGNTDLDKVVLNFGIPRGDPGLNGTGVVVNTVADLRNAPNNGTATTLGCNAAGDGGGGFWRWDATSALDDNTGTIVMPTGHVGNGRWIRQFQGVVNIRWFGAVGNDDLNGNGTDDTAAIQAALDFCLRYKTANTVEIPAGMTCKTTDTLHLGYGQSYSHIVLRGVTLSTAAPGSGIVYCGPPDRPAINIQGCRTSAVDNLRITRQSSKFATFPGLVSGVPSSYRTELSNYTELGAVTNATAPFCAICIDGYSDTWGGAADGFPAGFPTNQKVRYPTVNYPAWTGISTQYNKALSRDARVTNCGIRGFYIGVMQSPMNSATGDFTQFTNTSVSYCGYAFAWSNANSRLNDFSNTQVLRCWTGWTNRLLTYAYPGYGSSGTSMRINNANLNEYGYQIFDISYSSNSPFTVINCYTESLMQIGNVVNLGQNTSTYAQFSGCNFHFWRVAENNSFYKPARLMTVDGNFYNCRFNHIHGIEGVYGSAAFTDCTINNVLAQGTYPTTGSPAEIGLKATGGFCHTYLERVARDGNFKGQFNITYAGANATRIRGGDSSSAIEPIGGAWVYSANFDNREFYGTGFYKLPASLCLYTRLSTDWSISGNTATVTAVLQLSVKLKVGDVLCRNSADMVFLVTGVADSGGNQTVTLYACTNWNQDNTGTVTLGWTAPTSQTTWRLYRTGKNQLGGGYCISATSGSAVVTITTRTGTTVADPSTLISAGETLTVCPISNNASLALPPFVGPVEVVSISGTDITVNQNAKKTAVFPWAPALPDYPDF